MTSQELLKLTNASTNTTSTSSNSTTGTSSGGVASNGGTSGGGGSGGGNNTSMLKMNYQERANRHYLATFQNGDSKLINYHYG